MRAAAASVLALPLLVACETVPPRSSSLLTTELFEDIPVPKSARYEEADLESFAYSKPTFRCGRFFYEYSGAHADAVAFFRKTMTLPPYSWRLETDEANEGSATLVFRKNDDRCTVDVDRIRQKTADAPAKITILVRVNYRR